jgi:hypothetical protein
MPGDFFFTEHMAVLWCKQEDFTAFTTIVGERKSELIFRSAGLFFEMYNQEPTHLFPRHIPEYSHGITIRGLHQKHSIKDILNAITSCSKLVYNIWFEGLQRLQGLGLLPAKDKLQDRIFLLVKDRDSIYDLMKSPIQTLAYPGSKMYMSCTPLPDSQNETLSFNRKTLAFVDYCQKQSKLPHLLREQLSSIDHTHAKGIAPYAYEYTSKGSRRFLPAEKSRSRKVAYEQGDSHVSTKQEDDSSTRLKDMLSTINSLVAKQADYEKQNASLQVQLNLQKKKQEEIESDLEAKKKDDSKRKNDLKHLMDKDTSRDKRIKALECSANNFREGENRLMKLYEESNIRFKTLEETNSDLVRLLVQKNILTPNTPHSPHDNV